MPTGTGERGTGRKADPPLPDKRYFGIREVAELCGVRPHVLRYWEQEFPRLSPPRGGGNRRYYRPRDVRLIRRIRYLLWDCRYTIEGARRHLEAGRAEPPNEETPIGLLKELRGELAALVEELDRPPESSGGSPSGPD